MSAFTNRYTFLYVTILVLIITVLLTGVYFGTKERQDANRTLENASQILKAAGYEVDKTQVQKLFEEVTEIKKTENGKEFYSVITPKKQQSFVVPVSGKGLWGPIWGYVALADDWNTIIGVAFAHKSETPGLGDKITEEDFLKRFVGKKIKNEAGELVSVSVEKIGQKTASDINRVDAVSGATITSKGVEEMLFNSLKEVVK